MKRPIRIVTTTSVFARGYPAEEAAERLAAAGFDALDMALDYWVYSPESPFLRDGYLDWARALRDKAERLGAPYTHSHAPGGADSGDLIGRSIETAAALGARYMVLHPMYREENGDEIVDPERFVELNSAAVRPWLDPARKRGVVILSENLLDGACADPRNICALVEAVGSEYFGWCFDTGHAHCRGFGADILDQCTVAPLSLHLQDNEGDGDSHLIPGDGTVDWRAVADALKRADYRGDCVLEAHHQCLEAPENQKDAVLRRLLESGKRLREMMI